MTARLLVVLGVVVLVGALTWLWRRREGRIVEAHGAFDRSDLGLSRRERPSAVVVDFFGEDCAPCRVVEQRLEKLRGEIPDLAVVSIDAGRRMDLADRYHVRRVPTLFVADGDLRIIWRVSGVPSEDAIRSALLGPDWTGRPHPERESHETAEPSR